MNVRFKELRNELKLSQEAIGEKLGIKRSAVSLIESGKSSLTEKNILLICRTFGVNEEWLRTGEGEMFKEDDFFFDLGYYTQDASDIDKAIIIEFLKLDEESKQTMIKYWKNVINKLDDN